MPAYRIGFGSDFNLNNSNVGIGTTLGRVKLDVAGTLKGDFNITGVTTLKSYGGFAAQKQLGDDDTITNEVNTISEDIVVSVGKTFTVSVGATVYPGTLESVSIGTHFSFPNGGITARPEEPIEGTVRFNDDLNTLEFYNGVEWRQFTVDGSSGRGVFAGGYSPNSTVLQTIDYINISSTGNAIDFGNLSLSRRIFPGCSSSTRGIFGGGATPSVSNVIDYITISSQGNAIDFGDLSAPSTGRYALASFSSSTRGIFVAGYNPSISPLSAYINIIDYITISTIGNALDFGDADYLSYGPAGCSSPTRGIFGGGQSAVSPYPDLANISYLTISSTGNSINFGSLTDVRYDPSSASNNVIGLFAGGGVSFRNTIDYITIASVGNAQDFGDLTVARRSLAASSTQIRAVFSGGYSNSSPITRVNTIDYVTISSKSNAMDFGDLVTIRAQLAGCSDSHGGLGGF